MRQKYRLLALLLAAALVLSGCGARLQEVADKMSYGDVIPYTEMEYSRPDPQELEQALAESCRVAAESDDADQVMDAVYAFYDVYDRFYTSLALADIHYSGDMRDTYWEEEYNYCSEKITLADAGLDELYDVLADAPCRETLDGDEYFGPGFLDAYEGESFWDDTFTAMMEREAALQSEYYELSAQAAEEEYGSEAYYSRYGTEMGELLVKLVALRQQIAAYAGYSSYPEFAGEVYHYRDYTSAQAEAYLEEIGRELEPLYRAVNTAEVWDIFDEYCSEEQTFRYVQTAAENMGGDIAAAFSVLEEGTLYDIEYRENKFDSSFEVYLWSYHEPFVFMKPYLDPTDQLVFAHEFGHFVNDYVCWGSHAGTDVAEIHSQAMEYLSLCYHEDTEELEVYKLADSLCLYVEQAAYALFEQRLYGLTGKDLTVENVQALYEETCLDFGFDSWDFDSRSYVDISHFYTSPMYVVSYVVSNDLAFQIYQLEKAEPGAGLAVYAECIYSMDSGQLYFAETYGLESPFAPGRLETVKQTLQTGLKDYI